MAPFLNHFNLLRTISLVYVLLITITFTYTGSSLTLDEECLALFQFKQSFINEDDVVCTSRWLQKFDTWKPTSNSSDIGFDCCKWDGVLCRNEDQVIGLDLSESFLCGHINSTSTLFNLVNLQTLNLAMNNFNESKIPSEIALLKQLKSLNLSDSGFTGEIPIEISKLVQLYSLDLSRNPLKLQSPGLNLVQNMTTLEVLHLSGVHVSSSVPHFLANFSSLRSIRLFGCLLQGEFPSAIFNLPKLEILSLASNANLTGSFPEFRKKSLLRVVNVFSTSFFGIIPESISNLNHLIYFRLTACSFSGHIPGSFSNFTQLTFLGLAGNQFTGLVPSLASLSKLDSLELSGNSFQKGPIPNWLGKLTKLTNLYLTATNMYGEIPPFLANLTKLSVVAIGKNSLTGHIPPSLFNLTLLTNLDLQENQLQGPISSSFSNFKRLEQLRLTLNNFSGRVDIDMFLGLSELDTLALGHGSISLVSTNNYTNNTATQLRRLVLTSCNLKEFPAFLHFQNKLSALLLSHNLIEGMVPVWIWNNSRETLGVIDLTYNNITGFHQHPRILPWLRLQGLFMRNNQLQGHLPVPPQTTVVYDVSYNNLTGKISPLICEAKSLRVLDLSSNNMGGTLPPCLGSSSNLLFILNLRGNNFRGEMMNVFTHGSQLLSIDLSENGFTGQLPRSLTNCTDLEVLSLGDNSFNDVFPFWLGILAKLQVLVLRSNGPIQDSKNVSSHFSKLRIIDLSNNRFNGRLHERYFENWNAMKSAYNGESSVLESLMFLNSFTSQRPYSMTLIYKGVRTQFEQILDIFTAIDLSSNNFEGDITISLQDLRGLESLNLSNNHFTGGVFPSLGYLKNLESLDLSRNKLSGEIPQQLVQLGFLAIFNVSFNNLDGRIPLGKQFNTFDKSSYEGNPRLCGEPLSNECQNQNAPRPSRPEPTSDESDSLFPSEGIDWVFVFSGVGSGLIIGILVGNFLHTRYSDRITKRKDIWIRPLGDKRSNQV